MKYIFLATCLSFFASVQAQLPIKLKYDEAKYSVDSTFVILKSGSKYAAYDLTKDAFEIPFGKSKLFLFENSNVFAKIDFKTKKLSLHFLSKQIKIDAFGTENSVYFGTAFPLSVDGLYDANGKLTYIYDEAPIDGFSNPPYDWAKQELVRLKNEIYIVNNYKSELAEYGYVNSDVPSIVKLDIGYQKSGVFDFENNSWLIQPKYQECKLVNSTIICSYRADVNNELIFDYYSLNTAGEIELQQEKSTKLSDEIIKLWFGQSAQLMSYENGYGVYRLDGKMGLFYFNLTTKNGSSINRIYYSDLLKNMYSIIAYSEFMNAILSYSNSDKIKYSGYVPVLNSNQIELKEIASCQNKIEVFYEPKLSEQISGLIFKFNDSTLLYMKDSIPFFEYYQTIYDSHFELSIVNDFAIVNDYHFGYDQYPLFSVFGDDSVVVDEWGNYQLVFEYGILPQGKSFIYKMDGTGISTDKMYYSIAGGSAGFILQDFSKDGTGNYQSSYVLMDFIGEQIQNSLSSNDVLINPNYLIHGYEGKYADSIFIAPNGYDGHLVNRDQYYGVYYIQGNGKMGIYKPEINFKNTLTNEMYEFVHYHPQLDVTLLLKDDSIWLYSLYDTLSVSKSGKIIYTQGDYYFDPSAEYQIITIDNGDTTLYGEGISDSQGRTEISIEIKNDFLFINDTGYDQVFYCVECIDEFGDFISTREVRIQPENSSVWQKTNNGWKKISPYYANVFLTSDQSHIIANSGYYKDVIDESRVIKNIESRYFYMDSTLRGLSVGDYFSFSYIEDLGFGLKVQFNSGEKYFFMTYDGKAITNADWDNFEIENGKLKAILETVYEIDLETGELMYNEYGGPIEVVSGTIKYFNLPR